MWFVARVTPFFSLDGDAAPGVAGEGWRGWQVGLAIGLGVAGVTLAVFAVGLFARDKTTVHPETPEKATTLVMDGVYRFTRNPMYLGMFLVLLGWAIYLGNAASLLVAFIFVLYINRFQISREEAALTANFGEAYLAYKSRVRRWL